MKKNTLFFVLLVSALGSFSCRKSNGSGSDSDGTTEESAEKKLEDGYAFSAKESFQAKLEWIHPPKSGVDAAGSNFLLVYFLKPNGNAPETVKILDFQPRQAQTGQGSIKTSQKWDIVEDVSGQMLVKGIIFTAPGPEGFWNIEFTAAVDGKTDNASLPVAMEVVPIKP